MGELARQRRARDLWISRSHLWAVSIGVLAATTASFFLGMALARSPGASPATPTAATAAPDESLVELLARVDANAEPDSGVNNLTFPDALTGIEATATLPPAPEVGGDASVVQPGAVGNRPTDLMVAMADPSEATLLAEALRGRGWTVEIREADGDDVAAQLVIQGGEDLSAAREAREDLIVELAVLERQLPVSLIPR